jgi:hypothetical protein
MAVPARKHINTHFSQFELSHAVSRFCSTLIEMNGTFDIANLQSLTSKVTANRQRVRTFRYGKYQIRDWAIHRKQMSPSCRSSSEQASSKCMRAR